MLFPSLSRRKGRRKLGLVQGNISGLPGRSAEGFGVLRPPKQCNYSSKVKKRKGEKTLPEIPHQLPCWAGKQRGSVSGQASSHPPVWGRLPQPPSQTLPSLPAQATMSILRSTTKPEGPGQWKGIAGAEVSTVGRRAVQLLSC